MSNLMSVIGCLNRSNVRPLGPGDSDGSCREESFFFPATDYVMDNRSLSCLFSPQPSRNKKPGIMQAYFTIHVEVWFSM